MSIKAHARVGSYIFWKILIDKYYLNTKILDLSLSNIMNFYDY